MTFGRGDDVCDARDKECKIMITGDQLTWVCKVHIKNRFGSVGVASRGLEGGGRARGGVWTSTEGQAARSSSPPATPETQIQVYICTYIQIL